MSGRGGLARWWLLEGRSWLSIVAAGRHELDFINEYFELAAADAVALPLTPPQFALDGDLRPLAKVLRHGTGTGAEHYAVDEVGVVLPFVGGRILSAIVDGHAEAQYFDTGLSGAKIRVAREVSADDYSIDTHENTSLVVVLALYDR